jgi:3-hydroxyacyl-CoA dehydrogenase
MSIKRVGVLGLGLMGSGIAQITAANAGLAVIALDSTEASLRKGIDSIRKSLSIMAGKVR